MRADARRWWSVAISVLCRPRFSTKTATMPFTKKKTKKRPKSKATANKPKRRRMSASDRALARVRARACGWLAGGRAATLPEARWCGWGGERPVGSHFPENHHAERRLATLTSPRWLMPSSLGVPCNQGVVDHRAERKLMPPSLVCDGPCRPVGACCAIRGWLECPGQEAARVRGLPSLAGRIDGHRHRRGRSRPSTAR